MLPAMERFDARALLSLGRVGAVAPHPEGSWLAVAVSRVDEEGGRFLSALWRVPSDGSGAPVRLTRGKHNDRAPAFRSDGALGFLSDRPTEPSDDEAAGKRRSQVWVLSAGAEPEPLTDEPLGVSAFRFAANADRLVVQASVLPGVEHEKQREVHEDRKKHGPTGLRYSEMPVRYWDHWLPEAATHLVAYDGSGEGRQDLTPDGGRELRDAEWDLSRDGALVVVTEQRPGVDRIDDTSLLLIDVGTATHRRIAGGARTSFSRPLLSPGGERVACSRSVRRDAECIREHLHIVDVEAAAGHDVAVDWERFPEPACWTDDGRAVLVTACDGGASPVFRIDVGSGEVARITATDAAGTHQGIQVSGGAAVGVRSTLLQPPAPFRVPLAPEATPETLADLAGPTGGVADRVTVEWLTTPSDDGVPIQWLLLRAKDAPASPAPALLWIHGGPIGHWADWWHWRWNPLPFLERGYAVALPNPRGSLGFGQDFVAGIWGNEWGAQCYRDVMAVTDALAARPEVDAERLGAMGGSFGGYMTNWIGGSTDRFRCLVTHAALATMSAFHGVTDLPSWWSYMMGEDPYADRDAFDRYAPLGQIASWRSPTLVVHGERDYRVPISEALALFEGLQAHGVESELLVYPDEGHWIERPRNITHWYDAILDYLDRYLQPG